MARLIPKKTNSDGRRHITWADLLICVLTFLLVVFVVISALPCKGGIVLLLIVAAIVLIYRADAQPNYIYALNVLKYIVLPHRYARDVSDAFLLDRKESKKIAFGELFSEEDTQAQQREQELKRLLDDPNVSKEVKEKIRRHRLQEEQRSLQPIVEEREDKMKCSPVEQLLPFTDIADDCIAYGNRYFGAAMRLPLTQAADEKISQLLQLLLDEITSANIVKLDRPSEQADTIFMAPAFYLVLFEEDKACLQAKIDRVCAILTDAKRLNSKELAVFLKYSNFAQFEENDVHSIPERDYALWAMPDFVKIKPNSVEVNSVVTYNLCASRFPTLVDAGWLAKLFKIPSAKFVIKLRSVEQEVSVTTIGKAFHAIDPTMKGYSLQYAEGMSSLLTALENNNEKLFEIGIYATAYDRMANEIESARLPQIPNFKFTLLQRFEDEGILINRMPFDQTDAFLGSQISALNPCRYHTRMMPAETIAAALPWMKAEAPDIGVIGGVDASKEEVTNIIVLGDLNIQGLDDESPATNPAELPETPMANQAAANAEE